ncbi:hypothetical protein ABW19_dt0204346 [Dactylella cylindrospora]|nr:hypothetical protein ABW19_dt0204346 [Dactylella cylindrospora]
MPSTRQSLLHNANGNSQPPVAATVNQTPTVDRSSQQDFPQSCHHPLHSQWQFAAVWEFLYQFHDGLKCPHYEDIEDFANDLTNPTGTQLLHDVQIGLLKNVSSQRGLTYNPPVPLYRHLKANAHIF